MKKPHCKTQSLKMEKLEMVQPYIAGMDYLFGDLYQKFTQSVLVKRDQLPAYAGIYVFYENGLPIYVGRANNIRKRIQWHTRASSGSESASFAFNLAKMEYGTKNEINKRRKELMQIEEFLEIFKRHKVNLANLDFRCIHLENDILQTMFEPFLALRLGTYPLNNTFENH